ncbi:hypothetical protein GWK47_035680 [Chionoecetes opilio]|uniref:Uncharacterized protein n=1 Tax=Chionoecetes opilio TaxID=41210 RepID=A0A8J4YGK7_CHIOP|nr:hypothetical protein GWK47_035680 [Chionoecetes opilio]
MHKALNSTRPTWQPSSFPGPRRPFTPPVSPHTGQEQVTVPSPGQSTTYVLLTRKGAAVEPVSSQTDLPPPASLQDFKRGTQPVLISSKQDAVNWDQNAILLEGRKKHLQESVNILGVEFDSGFTYTSHVRKVAKDAAWKLAASDASRTFWTLRESAKSKVTSPLRDGILAPPHGPPDPVIPRPP